MAGSNLRHEVDRSLGHPKLTCHECIARGSLFIGAISLVVMRREVFPNFQLDILLVTVPYPGASPEETEEAICEKIESAVKGVVGIRKVTSVGREGSGFVILELSNDINDVQQVLAEVRSQIDQIPNFPTPTMEAADIQQIVFRAPAIQIAILSRAQRFHLNPF